MKLRRIPSSISNFSFNMIHSLLHSIVNANDNVKVYKRPNVMPVLKLVTISVSIWSLMQVKIPQCNFLPYQTWPKWPCPSKFCTVLLNLVIQVDHSNTNTIIVHAMLFENIVSATEWLNAKSECVCKWGGALHSHWVSYLKFVVS